MITKAYPIFLNIIAFITITIPIIIVFYIRNKSKFRIGKYLITGILAYLLSDRLLAPFLFGLIVTACDVVSTESELYNTLLQFVAPVFYALSEFFVFWLCERFILKKDIKVTEIVALPIIFYFMPIITGALSLTSYAQVASASLNGTLEELVSETLTLDILKGYVDDMTSTTFSAYVCTQVFTRFAIMITMVFSCIFLFHGIKKKKFINYLYAYLVLIINYELISLISEFIGIWPCNIYLIFVIGFGIYGIFRYFKWYQKEKETFIKQMSDYKQSLKTNKK